MKRIEIIDSLRGIAIITMLLFHTSYYWDSQLDVASYNNYLHNPLAMIALIFGKFAGIFAIITGMAYTYSVFYKREHANRSIRSMLETTLTAGIMVVIISKIHVAVFNHTHTGDPIHPYPTGPKYYTLLTGSIETGIFQIPNKFTLLYRSTALLMIGICIIWTGALLAILLRKDGIAYFRRNLIITFLIGTTIILSTQFLKNSLRPVWISFILNDQTLPAFLLGIFIGDPFPFFPFAGYSTYGMIFGMAFYENIPSRTVTSASLLFGGAYLGTGIYLYIVHGYARISKIYETPELQLNLIQIGMMIIFSMIIYDIHYMNETNPIRRAFLSTGIRRFGLLTLTIFMLEPLLGTSIKVFVLDPLFGMWSRNIGLAACYGISLIGLWSIILTYWERYNFIGSWEWLNSRLFQKITNQQTMRIDIKKNLYVTQEIRLQE